MVAVDTLSKASCLQTAVGSMTALFNNLHALHTSPVVWVNDTFVLYHGQITLERDFTQNVSHIF